ncbi:MAG TPA: glycosyltransferase [Urbifossiella sp.]|jgi:glycosyltransferase involved in cell wall biosynthesis|nr:glycosyltransferase [Urbifossiella sp.]
MTPRVSIVMAAKNYARFLPMAVESVRAQTFADWELIVVDDGSTDDTPRVVQRFLDDSRIRYVRSDLLGQSRAKNLGIGLSRGEFVAFLDADDAWLPTKLEKQVALFHNNPEVGVVYARRLLMDEDGRVAKPLAGSRPPSSMFVQNFVCFSSAVVRREVFSRVGGFNPEWDLSIDYDLWLRVGNHYTFAGIDEELVLYRTGHGNLSKKLADRVATAMAIMHRAETHYRIAEPREVIAEGYASTCRTIGYVMRPSEPLTAVKWYWKSLRWPHGRFASMKGLAASVLAWLRGQRMPGAAENATANR